MNDPRGYYDKFCVIRRDTGVEVEEPTFTLLPTNDPAARVALATYARAVQAANPGLCNDLLTLLDGLPDIGHWSP